MHVGFGIYEGKEICSPKGCGPLSTRALTIKEEIFSIIDTRVNEAHVLDINDSNGIYGIESLSRGAICCRFVTCRKEEAEVIRKNLKAIGVDPKGLVFEDTIREFLENPTLGECVIETYDVIFFELKGSDDLSLINAVLSKQKPSGVTAIIRPNNDTFKIPKKFDGSQIMDTREFEDKKVEIILKANL